jgi:hypothetical protein
MAAVLAVDDVELGRRLAMKLLTEERILLEPSLTSRFLREAQILARLDHPGIVPLHELGVDPDGQPYFTMKFVDGRTLEDLGTEIRSFEDGWTRVAAVRLLLHVCEAVAYAHGKSVVHRDLKPANIMVGGPGEAYVMDWGIARVLGGSEVEGGRAAQNGTVATMPELTDGDVLGTPLYMSPEQALGQPVDVRSDVYSLGAVLYWLLSGSAPYESERGKDGSRSVLELVRSGPPESIATLAAKAPPELHAICEKAMNREPEGRYADAAELAGDLRAYLENRVVRAHQSGAIAEFRKWVGRNRGFAVALGAVVAGLVVGVVLLVAWNEQVRQKNERISEARVTTLLANAALLGRQGDWRAALEACGDAREAGGSVVLTLFEEARCHAALFDRARLVEILRRLESRDDLGDERARVELRLAADGLRDASQESAQLDRIRAALSEGLPAADDAYGRSLIAATTADARVHLTEALRREPFHFEALSSLYWLEFLSGDFESAQRLSQVFRRVYPDHPAPLLQDVLRSIVERRVSETARLQLAPYEHGLGAPAMALLAELSGSAVPKLTELDLTDQASLFDPEPLTWMAEDFPNRPDVYLALASAVPPLPPLRRAWVRAITALGDLTVVLADPGLTETAHDQAAKSAYDELVQADEIHPDAAFEYFAGHLATLFRSPETHSGKISDDVGTGQAFASAIHHYAASIDQDSLFPLVRNQAIGCLFYAQRGLSARIDPDYEPAARKSLRLLVDEPRLSAGSYSILVYNAMALEEHRLALRLVDRWMELAPDHIEPLLASARRALEVGEYRAAIVSAELVLEEDKSNDEAMAIREQAKERALEWASTLRD